MEEFRVSGTHPLLSILLGVRSCVLNLKKNVSFELASSLSILDLLARSLTLSQLLNKPGVSFMVKVGLRILSLGYFYIYMPSFRKFR